MNERVLSGIMRAKITEKTKLSNNTVGRDLPKGSDKLLSRREESVSS
jgi:hypothetical protein